MDRREAMLRELHLYPQWQRKGNGVAVGYPAASPLRGQCRDKPAPVVAEQGMVAEITPIVSEVVAEQATPVPLVAKHIAEDTPLHRINNLDWPELKRQVRDCTACKLRGGCTQTVFGVGDEQANWLFVGEGPGADEDALGEPFVGQAGKLLDSMLAAIKLKRGSNVYIANVVKCRPPVDGSGKQLPPKPDEIAQCLPYLQRQIALIQPKLIVALGKTAATALLGREATLGSLRGTLHDYQGIPLVVTYHPAYLLRSPLEKAKAWQDLCLAVAAIE